MSTYKMFQKMIEVKGKKIQAEITIEVLEDDNSVHYDVASLKRKDAFLGIISVKASAFGCEGWDSLGECEIYCNNMFNPKPFQENVDMYLNEYNLVNNALKDLEDNILQRAKELKQFA